MARRKQIKFAEISGMSNVVEHTDPDAAQKVNEFTSKADYLVLELAAGRGEYSIGLAKLFPDRHFIAIDIQGERLWYGANQAIDEGLDNILFLRIKIEELTDYFAEDQVDEIWITFPDPFPRKKQQLNRLTSPRFLPKYAELLKPNGILHLKTDDLDLFEYSIQELDYAGAELEKILSDIYARELLPPELRIKTYFEQKHLDAVKQINYLRYRFAN